MDFSEEEESYGRYQPVYPRRENANVEKTRLQIDQRDQKESVGNNSMLPELVTKATDDVSFLREE